MLTEFHKSSLLAYLCDTRIGPSAVNQMNHANRGHGLLKWSVSAWIWCVRTKRMHVNELDHQEGL